MSKARDLANAGTALTTVSATELGYLDGVTSAVQTQINSKEATLPDQTGNTGKYLTTDGSAKSWGTVSQYALPTQTGNSGKFLTTNGTSESWATATVDKATAPFFRTIVGLNPASSVQAVNVDSNNKIYATGVYFTGGPTNFTPGVFCVRFAADGTIENGRHVKRDTYGVTAFSAFVDTSGNHYFAGNDYDGSTQNKGSMYKTNSDGVIQWSVNNQQTTRKTNYKTFVDSSGNVYECGVTDPSAGTYRAYFTKYNSSGVVQFYVYTTNTGNYFQNICQAITTDSSGNIYAAYDYQPGSTNEGDTRIIKFDSNGTKVWDYLYRLNSTVNIYETPYSIVTDSSGNVYFSGQNGTNTFIIKLDSSGNITWQRVISGRMDLRGITIDSANNDVYLGGTRYGPLTGSRSVVIKYNSSGTLQWSRIISSRIASENIFSIVAPTGNYFYIGGNVGGESYNEFGFVAKLYKDGTGTGVYNTSHCAVQYIDAALTDSAYSASRANITDTPTRQTPTASALMYAVANTGVQVGVSTGYIS